MQFVQHILYTWDREMVFDCDHIESPVVGTKSPYPIFLSDQENG